MYPIGSYAIPQIQSVNPDMDIDSFVTPASNDPSENKLNSGVDLQFCVMDNCENKEAAYEVLDFLLEDENIQTYLDDQKAVPCKEGDFTLPSTLDGMKEYIEEGRMADYQDHYYPTEMAVDAQIQTFLMKKDKDAFLKNLIQTGQDITVTLSVKYRTMRRRTGKERTDHGKKIYEWKKADLSSDHHSDRGIIFLL